MSGSSAFDRLFKGEGEGKARVGEEPWSEDELSRLKRNYHRVKRGELNRMFPNRTPSAVNNKVYRLMKDGVLASKRARVRVGGVASPVRVEVPNVERRFVGVHEFSEEELVVLRAGSLGEAGRVSRELGVRVSCVRRFYRLRG